MFHVKHCRNMFHVEQIGCVPRGTIGLCSTWNILEVHVNGTIGSV